MSEPNKGSRFHFTSKFGLVNGKPAQTGPMAKVNLQSTPVLVIDDHATNWRILEAKLKGWSMPATLVESGYEGLVAMRRAKDTSKPFPLIQLDAQMSGVDGYMVASEAAFNLERLARAGDRVDADSVLKKLEWQLGGLHHASIAVQAETEKRPFWFRRDKSGRLRSLTYSLMARATSTPQGWQIQPTAPDACLESVRHGTWWAAGSGSRQANPESRARKEPVC